MLKVGDKITVKLHRQKNLLQATAFVTVRTLSNNAGGFTYSELYENSVYIGMAGVSWEREEGVDWIRGHDGPDVRAFVTAAVLSR